MNDKQRERLVIWQLQEWMAVPPFRSWDGLRTFGALWPLVWLDFKLMHAMIRPAVWIARRFRK